MLVAYRKPRYSCKEAPRRADGTGGLVPCPARRVRRLAWVFVAAFVALAALPAPCRAEGRIDPGLAWCGNVVDPSEYAACRAAGFDAVRIDVLWMPAHSWQVTDALVEMAGAQGLKVILALQTAAPPSSFGSVDPDNPLYLAQAQQWIQEVVEHYRDSPALLGWMVSDEPERALRLTEAGFRAFLQGRYGDVVSLNRAWGSRYSELAGANASGALVLARQRALGICRAGTDLALFQQQAFQNLMGLWARYIRAADSRRPIFTGGMASYRCLISVPGEYDAIVARLGTGGGAQPGGAVAVAIARRSGSFNAIAALPARDPLGAFGDALLQGATGIAVEDWCVLRGSPTLRAGLAAALARWRKAARVSASPRPTAAILYEPFGESLVPSPLLTGYLAGSDTGELGTLFATFRHGTAFGQVGYLAREDLTTERLSQYRVLFCPAALSLTSEDVHALARFAEAGGVVVADVGFGSYEAGGYAYSWSVELATLIGVRALWPPIGGGGNLRVYDNVSLFPSIPAGAVSAPVGGRAAFTDLAAMIQPLPGSTVFGASLDRTLPDRKLFGGIVARPAGKGWVVYASMKLWDRWSPADPLYLAFHRDLMSRQPVVALKNAPFLGGDVAVAAFEQGLGIRNSGSRAVLAGAVTPGDALYAGSCINICRPAGSGEGLEVKAGLAADTLGLYERTPIRCMTVRAPMAVAVEEYGPAGIRIVVCGGRPYITLSDAGAALMAPSYAQQARITIGDGRYPVRPGSRHLLRVKEQGSADVKEYQIVVGPDARIEMDKEFYCEVLALTPLPAAGTGP